MTNNNKKAQQLTKLIPALNEVPEQDRLNVFNGAFKNNYYRLLLLLVAVLFVLVFYFNINHILNYQFLEKGGMLARSVHFLKELGISFFLPLMAVFLILVLGRNFFVKQQIKKYLSNKNH